MLQSQLLGLHAGKTVLPTTNAEGVNIRLMVTPSLVGTHQQLNLEMICDISAVTGRAESRDDTTSGMRH
ncbi:hypothetical protein RRF57_010727 [Xylaria bambusicola]|uniref:Uncharacterized protein n=1 Tax=Xylaria bambusicola TaxID=326684 RepID=A0AAN7Z305_9PEZI